MKKTIYTKAREVHLQARMKFNPIVLSAHLKKDGDILIVDKSKVFCESEDDSLFFVLLNSLYKWDYCTNMATTTIFYEINDEHTKLYGGVYDESAHEKKTHCLVAAIAHAEVDAPYIYTAEKMNMIVDNLQKST